MTTETDAPEGVADDTSHVDIDPIDAANPDQSADDAGADTVEGADGQDQADKPRKPTAQERIDELTRARREAERDAEFWKSKATAKEDPKPATQPQADEDPEPEPADFQFGETDPGYIKALGAHAARQQFAALAKQQAAQTQASTARQADADRRAAFAKDHPDFEAKVMKGDWACTTDMAAALEDSEHGPAVAYHLASNPTEARRIAALSPIAQVRELGRIEARLEPASTTTPVKTVSDAPEPAQTLRGKGGQFKAPADTSDFETFDKTYGN